MPVAAVRRQEIIELLNEALSCEYHSFIGHALNSNPFVAPGMEKDVEILEQFRDDENANAKALLVQFGRYRAGPTLKAFRFWKEDLNFLGIDWLVVRAAEIAKADIARVEALIVRLPADDAELQATFQSILATKRRHASELGVLAVKRQKDRDARRATAYAATSIPMKKGAAAAAKPAAAAPASGAAKSPPLPGAPKPPTPPGAPKFPGAPKPPSPPLPPGAPRPPSAGASSPSPPLPPGAPKPPSAPKPPGPPSPPKPPVAKTEAPTEPAATEAPTAPAEAASDGPTLAGPPGPDYKPTPPKPYVPKHKR